MCLTYSELPLPVRLISAIRAGRWGFLGSHGGGHLRGCPKTGFSDTPNAPGRGLNRVHHDLGYTVSSTTGGTAHVTLSQYSNAYHRGLRFDALNRGRVCGLGAA